MAIKEYVNYFDFGTKLKLSTGEELDRRAAGYESRKLRVSSAGKHNPFDTDHVLYQGGAITGSAPYWDESWQDYPFLIGESWYPATDVVEPDFGGLAARLVSSTDPSKPDVDIANFIGELKDMPQMLKSIGDSFLNKGTAYAFGHLNLTYKFGWAPFARDVVALIQFQELAQKRFNQLKKLKQNGMSLRKRHLFRGKSNASMEFSQGQFDFTSESICDSQIGGYVMWKTNDEMPEGDDALSTMARDAALGLTLRAEVAWNLLPWSWLIDWCSNVGDFLGANRNRVGFYPAIVNLTRMRTWSSQCFGTTSAWAAPYFSGAITPRTRMYRIKERFSASPSLTAHLPILDFGQVGILASIKATRR